MSLYRNIFEKETVLFKFSFGPSFSLWLLTSTSLPDICDGTEVHVIQPMFLLYTLNQLKLHYQKFNTQEIVKTINAINGKIELFHILNLDFSQKPRKKGIPV